MATERVPCRTLGCTFTILPATAKANDGYCMPCVHKRAQQEYDEFVRQNRREVDPYANLNDPIKLILAIHEPRERDPLIDYRPPPKSAEELYLALTGLQAAHLMKKADNAFSEGRADLAETIAVHLATLTTFSLEPLLNSWVSCHHYWPSVIFRDARKSVRENVIKNLGTQETNIHEALRALAWIGGPDIRKKFHEWESNPPNWLPDNFTGFNPYAHEAGWELTPQAGLRDLYYEDCWAITPVTPEETFDTSVRTMTEAESECPWCPWCQRQLVKLVEIELSDERFAFLGSQAGKLPFLTCDACTCYGFMYARVLADGTAILAAENLRPQGLPESVNTWIRSEWARQPVRLKKRRAIHAVNWLMELPASQIGGMPTWIQSPAYPPCPDCSETMKFAAQIDTSYFPTEEGIYYAFYCERCRVTATTFQQS